MSSQDNDCIPPTEPLVVAEANNHLAVHLYKLLAKEKTNVFFSPFSLSTALAMLFCGSGGETANEMKPVLGYDIAKIKDHDIKSCFQNLLKTIGETDAYTLACANSVLSDKAFPVKKGFKTLLEESFKALIQEVDFKNESQKAVQQVNEWVKEKTNGMIPQLMESLKPDTVMIILNAVYFKGFWLNPFTKCATFKQNFYNEGIEKNAKQVEMMHLKENFPYLEKQSYKALQLPYKGGDISMLILLPNSRKGLDQLEVCLTSSFIYNMGQEMKDRKVEVALPKFRMEYSQSLKKQFQCMGIRRLFCEGAEFDGINESKLLYTSEIIHKAVIEVNEGAEAAAVTGTSVVMAKSCLKRRLDPKFIVDHPFLFAIYIRKTNLILFMGRIVQL